MIALDFTIVIGGILLHQHIQIVVVLLHHLKGWCHIEVLIAYTSSIASDMVVLLLKILVVS
jgi:hypothetical protein